MQMRPASLQRCRLTAIAFCFVSLLQSAHLCAQDARVRNLLRGDSAARGSAKNELLTHPDPAVLLELLQALPSSTGSNRDDLLEVLAQYNDPRKIPVYIAIAKDSKFKTWPYEMGNQLSKLGAPAAQALVDGCAGEGEDYGTWAGVTIGWMHDIGTPFLIDAVESAEECKHRIGVNGLKDQFGDADPQSPYRSELAIAIDAVIDPDDRIRNATRELFDSWKNKKQNDIDFEAIVETLIRAYQAQTPPETMVKIAGMLSEIQVPRVTRFMRAAVHAPNPEIQQTARNYLMSLPEEPKPKPAGTKQPRTPEAKIAYLKQLASQTEDNKNSQAISFLRDSDSRVREQAAVTLGELNAASTDPRYEPAEDPETALPVLRLAMKDTSANVRCAVIEALASIRSQDDATSIAQALRDPDATVVLAAAKALSDLPDESATPTLIEIYQNQRNSSELRNQAFQTLTQLCDPSATQILLQGLETPAGIDFSAAQGLVCTLEKKPDPSVFEALREAEEHATDMVTHENLIRALGDTKNPAALPVLERIARSHHPSLAPRATEALGTLGDRRAFPVLTELLHDSNGNIRTAAALAFTGFSDFAAPPELLAALTETDYGGRRYVYDALVSSHDPKAIDAIIAQLPDRMAIYSLGKLHDPRAFSPLLAILQNPANTTDIRAAVISTFGEQGDVRAVEPLIAALNEDNYTLTQSATFALTKLKDKRAIEPLRRARSRWASGHRQNAQSIEMTITQALSALGDDDAVR